MALWVLPTFKETEWVVYWIVIRSARKVVRYSHKVYLELGFRDKIYLFEWGTMTFLTFTFPLEYFTSAILVLITYPLAKNSSNF